MASKIVLVGGGRGFIGSALVQKLQLKGYEPVIISRNPHPDPYVPQISWTSLQKNGFRKPCKGVVNLAGHELMDPFKQWGDKFKKLLHDSRIDTTKIIVEGIKEEKIKTDVWISSSAIGFYPYSLTAKYTENSAGGDPSDFLSDLCAEWEMAARLPKTSTTRHACMRIGLVLGRPGGLIGKYFPSFYCGAGGKIGTGEQWMSWIHIDDMVDLIIHTLENENVEGAVNATSPKAVTNGEFTKTFSKALYRPALITMPKFLLNFVFGPIRAKVTLEGQNVIPEKALNSGFKFKYPTIEEACAEFSRINLTPEEKAREKLVR